MSAATRLRRWLRMRTHGDAATACARQRRAFEGAVLLVRVYYAATLYVVALQVPSWRKWSEAAALAPRWPIAWIELIGVRRGVHLVMSFALAATLAAAVAPESRRARVLAAVALLELVALYYSFGSIGSGWTLWLWTAFLFVLLPDGNEASAATARVRRQRHLTVFWAAQVMLFGSFALSGAWKIAYAVVQISAGEVHAFAPDALARHVAKQLLSSGETSLLGPAIIENPILGWMPFLAVMYVELGALAAAFRPSLHRVWAVVLMAFHLATTLVLAMTFPRSVLLLAVLCAPSPFAPPQVRWWTVAYELPLLGPVLYRIRRGGVGNLRNSAGSRAAHEAN